VNANAAQHKRAITARQLLKILSHGKHLGERIEQRYREVRRQAAEAAASRARRA